MIGEGRNGEEWEGTRKEWEGKGRDGKEWEGIVGMGRSINECKT